MNGVGVRDTGRVLNVAGFAYFKKLSPRQVTTIPFDIAGIDLICEVDEQWSFVGRIKIRVGGFESLDINALLPIRMEKEIVMRLIDISAYYQTLQFHYFHNIDR